MICQSQRSTSLINISPNLLQLLRSVGLQYVVAHKLGRYHIGGIVGVAGRVLGYSLLGV